jgi:hypothetical protein
MLRVFLLQATLGQGPEKLAYELEQNVSRFLQQTKPGNHMETLTLPFWIN